MEMAVIMIRLDKYLADMGIGTRTEVKKHVRQGKVKVDGVVVHVPDCHMRFWTSQTPLQYISPTRS